MSEKVNFVGAPPNVQLPPGYSNPIQYQPNIPNFNAFNTVGGPIMRPPPPPTSFQYGYGGYQQNPAFNFGRPSFMPPPPPFGNFWGAPPPPPIPQQYNNFGRTTPGPQQVTPEVLTQKETDQKWITEFIKNRTRETEFEAENKKESKGMKYISFKVDEAFKLIGDIKSNVKGMSKQRNDYDDETWILKINYINQLKNRLESIKDEILQPEVLKEMKLKIKKYNKRKNGRKELRKRKECKYASEMEEREKKHKLLNDWRERLTLKDLEMKQKSDMKIEADNVLGEVRKKISESRRIEQQLQVLEKLRQARKENSLKKGLIISLETSEKFENSLKSIRTLLTKQIDLYQVEEQALQVMLDCEREEQKERDDLIKNQEDVKWFNLYQTTFNKFLFGNELNVPGHLQYFHNQYIARDHSSLFNIRYNWDEYLSNEKEASSIPIGWIKPEINASSDWGLALEK